MSSGRAQAQKKAARQGPLFFVASSPSKRNEAGEEIRTLDPNLGNGGISLSDSDLGFTQLLPIAEKYTLPRSPQFGIGSSNMSTCQYL
jgi:hypothetical protein